MTADELTIKRENLLKANEVRAARAQLRRRLKAGTAGVMDALADPCVAGMNVGDVVLLARGIGDAKAKRVLKAAKVAWTRQVRDVTVAELLRIEAALDDHAPSARIRSTTNTTTTDGAP